MKMKMGIKRRAIFLLCTTAVWIFGMGFVLSRDLNKSRELDAYADSVSAVVLNANVYYQNAMDIMVQASLRGERDWFQDEKKALFMVGKTIHDLKEKTPDIESFKQVAMTILNDLTEKIDIAENSMAAGNRLEQISHYNSNMWHVNKEMGLLSGEVIREQNAVQTRIYFKLGLGFLGFLSILAYSAFFLKKQILNPLWAITKTFEENTYEYRTGDLNLETIEDNEIGTLVKAYNNLRSRMTAVSVLNQKLNDHDNFEDILDFIFENFRPYIPYNRIGIATLSSDGQYIRALSTRSDQPIHLENGYEASMKSTSLRKIVETRSLRILNDLSQYLKEHPDSESTSLLVLEGMKSSMSLPLIVRERCLGVVFFSSIEMGAYNQNHVKFLKTIADSLAISFDQSFLNNRLLISTISGFARLIESRDTETGNHIERMQMYSVMLAEILQRKSKYSESITEHFINEVRDFSPIHDIGKVAVPDEILRKPGKLSEDEFEIMKKHAQIGGDIIENMRDTFSSVRKDFYKTGAEIVRYHHERYDGTGYPSGLKGQEIPLSARIVAVADVFDALTSKRPYKEAFSVEKAKKIILEGRGNHFDPEIIDAMMENWIQFEDLAKMHLESDSM